VEDEILRLYEYEGKKLFAKYGLRSPNGVFLPAERNGDISPEAVRKAVENLGNTFPLVLKAQVLSGGRGKRGFVRVVSDFAELMSGIREMLFSCDDPTFSGFLIERHVPHGEEFYLSVTYDGVERCPVILFSPHGGVDVEGRGDVERFPVDMVGGPPDWFFHRFDRYRDGLGDVARDLYRVFLEEDAELVEVNPLVFGDDERPVCLDAKVVLDDEAFFRHPDWPDPLREMSPVEREARKRGLALVELGGNIGVIANGAGLTMATMDMIYDMGGQPGTFLDLGGTDDPRRVEDAVKLMLMTGMDAVLVNIFGGMTKTDTVARGIKNALVERKDESPPMVVRLDGNYNSPPEDILAPLGIDVIRDMEEAVKRAVELAGKLRDGGGGR